MIGSDHVDPSLVEGFHECRPVACRLDGRIALYTRAEILVAGFVEPKMVYTHLGRNPLFRSMCFRKQRHLHRGGEMQDVQQRVEPARQFHCQA